MPARSFTDLIVWQKADQLTTAVFDITERFPEAQRSVFAPQMQQAVLSIGANIAEGFGRWLPKDKARFYTIAIGSAEELKHHWIIARSRGLMPGMERFWPILEEVTRMLRKLANMTRSQVRK